MNRAVPLLAALSIVFAACGDGERAAAPRSTPPTPSTTESVTTTVTPSSRTAEVEWVYTDPAILPEVRLIDPGSEPRAVREFNPEIGTRVDFMMTIDMAIAQSIGETENAVDTKVTIDGIAEVLDVTAEGITTQSTFSDARPQSSDPAAQAELERVYEAFRSLELSALTDRRGRTLASSPLDDVPGAELFPQGFGSIALPLPTEAIGPGAVWETTTETAVVDTTVLSTVTARLVGIDGTRLRLEITIDQEFGADSFPGITVNEITSTSEGTAVWDLELGVAVSSSMRSDQQLIGSIGSGEQTEAFTQSVTMQLDHSAG